MNIQDKLYDMQDKSYAALQARLIPTIPAESIIGVRVPEARKLAKELVKQNCYLPFLHCLPHQLFDENILHGLLIAEIKDYNTCILELERFLPYVDNWLVCDTISPKVFAKNKNELLLKIRNWIASDHIYTCRFGIKMLMTFYLDEPFSNEYLEIAASVHLDDYYVKMMIAWFFATALAKQWDAAIPYLENRKLDMWIHNKTIQKARESFRISNEQKSMLILLRRRQNNAVITKQP